MKTLGARGLREAFNCKPKDVITFFNCIGRIQRLTGIICLAKNKACHFLTVD